MMEGETGDSLTMFHYAILSSCLQVLEKVSSSKTREKHTNLSLQTYVGILFYPKHDSTLLHDYTATGFMFSFISLHLWLVDTH